MNLKEWISSLAKKEGLKDQISIGNIRELVGYISDDFYKDPHAFLLMLVNNGERRAKRKKKK